MLQQLSCAFADLEHFPVKLGGVCVCVRACVLGERFGFGNRQTKEETLPDSLLARLCFLRIHNNTSTYIHVLALCVCVCVCVCVCLDLPPPLSLSVFSPPSLSLSSHPLVPCLCCRLRCHAERYGRYTKRLDLSNNDLQSLEGVEQFTALEELILDGNGLTDGFTLPVLGQLQTLSLNKNKLTNIDGLIDEIKDKTPNIRSCMQHLCVCVCVFCVVCVCVCVCGCGCVCACKHHSSSVSRTP